MINQTNQVICPKHGIEWMDKHYDLPTGGFCMACDEIIEEEVEQASASANPFHAANNPLPEPEQVSFQPEKNIILLIFNADNFEYEDRQTGKTATGQMNVAHQTAFIEKARKNAKAQKCKLMVSIGFSSVVNEDYR